MEAAIDSLQRCRSPGESQIRGTIYFYIVPQFFIYLQLLQLVPWWRLTKTIGLPEQVYRGTISPELHNVVNISFKESAYKGVTSAGV